MKVWSIKPAGEIDVKYVLFVIDATRFNSIPSPGRAVWTSCPVISAMTVSGRPVSIRSTPSALRPLREHTTCTPKALGSASSGPTWYAICHGPSSQDEQWPTDQQYVGIVLYNMVWFETAAILIYSSRMKLNRRLYDRQRRLRHCCYRLLIEMSVGYITNVFLDGFLLYRSLIVKHIFSSQQIHIFTCFVPFSLIGTMYLSDIWAAGGATQVILRPIIVPATWSKGEQVLRTGMDVPATWFSFAIFVHFLSFISLYSK